MLRGRPVALALVGLLAVVACTGAVPPPPETPAAVIPAPPHCAPPAPPPCVRPAPSPAVPVPPVPPVPPFAATLVAGTSVEGRPIPAHVLGTGGDVVLVIAGIHGDEAAPTPLARALIRHLTREASLLVNRRVIVLPDANPDGRAAETRVNANGVDLNRNFPARNRRPGSRRGPRGLSEPEAETVERMVRLYRPARVLSIHQPLACVDYDGPALPLAERMAKACGLPVRKLGTRPGSMGAWLGEDRRVPLITLELPRKASSLDEAALWERYGGALLAFVTRRRP